MAASSFPSMEMAFEVLRMAEPDYLWKMDRVAARFPISGLALVDL